jgi:hypothetical protein
MQINGDRCYAQSASSQCSRSSPRGQNSQPKWACKTRHFGYGIDFVSQNLKSGHRLNRDRSKGNTNPNGRVKREKSGVKSHEMKAKSTRPFGLVIAKIYSQQQ